MFKDVFVLKKTSWHVKMMKYVWNLDYKDFSHMCPYWWLSVFNAVIGLWVVGFFKEGYKLLSLLFAVLSTVTVNLFGYIWVIISPPFKWVAKQFSTLFDYLDERRIEREIIKEKRLLQIKAEEERKRDERIEKLKEQYKDVPIEAIISKHKGNLSSEVKAVLYTLHGYWQVDEHAYNYRNYNTYRKVYNDIATEWGLKIEEPSNLMTFDEYERKRMIERKEFINKVNNIVRPIMKVIGYSLSTLLVAALLYGLWLSLPYIGIFFQWIWIGIVYVGKGLLWVGNGIIYCITHIPDLFKGISKHVSTNKSYWFLGLLLILIIVLIILFLVWLNEHVYRVRYSYKKTKGDLIFLSVKSFITKFFTKLFYPFTYLKYVGKFFIYLFSYIVQFFVFLKKCFYFLIQMLKNQCPAIKWED